MIRSLINWEGSERDRGPIVLFSWHFIAELKKHIKIDLLWTNLEPGTSPMPIPAAARLMGLRVRIPPWGGMDAFRQVQVSATV